jgi:hypothetical protein
LYTNGLCSFLRKSFHLRIYNFKKDNALAGIFSRTSETFAPHTKVKSWLRWFEMFRLWYTTVASFYAKETHTTALWGKRADRVYALPIRDTTTVAGRHYSCSASLVILSSHTSDSCGPIHSNRVSENLCITLYCGMVDRRQRRVKVRIVWICTIFLSKAATDSCRMKRVDVGDAAPARWAKCVRSTWVQIFSLAHRNNILYYEVVIYSWKNSGWNPNNLGTMCPFIETHNIRDMSWERVTRLRMCRATVHAFLPEPLLL